MEAGFQKMRSRLLKSASLNGKQKPSSMQNEQFNRKKKKKFITKKIYLKHTANNINNVYILPAFYLSRGFIIFTRSTNQHDFAHNFLSHLPKADFDGRASTQSSLDIRGTRLQCYFFGRDPSFYLFQTIRQRSRDPRSNDDYKGLSWLF